MKQVDEFHKIQKINSAIKLKKDTSTPKAKTARTPLPRTANLIAKALYKKFGYNPAIKGRRKAFIEEHLEEIKEIHCLNYKPEKALSLQDATFLRTWNDYISGRQIPDGKSLDAFAKWLDLDPVEFRRFALDEMSKVYETVDYLSWLDADRRHGNCTKNLVNLFDGQTEKSDDYVKVYCIKNNEKGKKIIQKLDKLLKETE